MTGFFRKEPYDHQRRLAENPTKAPIMTASSLVEAESIPIKRQICSSVSLLWDTHRGFIPDLATLGGSVHLQYNSLRHMTW